MMQILAFLCAVAAYLVLARDPHRTRAQLVLGAALAGGLPGLALVTAGVFSGHAADWFPFALFGMAGGALVGLAGVAAFALGDWLAKRP